MRPRINNAFDVIKFNELDSYLIENKVFGYTVKKNPNTLVYSYIMMFRNNKKKPIMLFIEVSKASKNVLNGWTDNGMKFNNIDELKAYANYGRSFR